MIHPEIPAPANLGYVIDDGAFYHPGDSLFVPEQKIDILALPTGAPWMKPAETVEYFRPSRSNSDRPLGAIPRITSSQAVPNGPTYPLH